MFEVLHLHGRSLLFKDLLTIIEITIVRDRVISVSCKGDFKMLSFNVRGDDVDVTDDVREYISDHVSKIDDYFEDGVSAVAHINLIGYKNNDVKAEITIIFPFLLLRGEATSADINISIDAAIQKIEQQIKKYKEKINEKAKIRGEKTIFKTDGADPIKLKVVRKKRIPLKQMDSDEAILQMNLLDHDFYAFKDINNETIDIVYRRKDGEYGLITTES